MFRSIFLHMFYAPFLLRKEKIDAIFVYGTSMLIQGLAAMLIKFIYKTNSVVWVQNLWPEEIADALLQFD